MHYLMATSTFPGRGFWKSWEPLPRGKAKETREQEARRKQAWAEAEDADSQGENGLGLRLWPEALA